MKIWVLLAVLALAIGVQAGGVRKGRPKKCSGICQAVSKGCHGGTVTPFGCADGKECCKTKIKKIKIKSKHLRPLYKRCKGMCLAAGSECDGKVTSYGCKYGKECCKTGKKTGGKKGKGCKGECQAVGSDCDGKVVNKGCKMGKQCCKKKYVGKPSKEGKPGKPGKKCPGECQPIGTPCDGKVKSGKTYGCAKGEECCCDGYGY
ncbi:unnamed protein product [Meganyctiphanes norvegica]|uniref:Uncharacterized protein n=1 Tax=Meganyctiphanes norvegica TaxID=48144 RepID=A0AAV2QYW3_MEGNR